MLALSVNCIFMNHCIHPQGVLMFQSLFCFLYLISLLQLFFIPISNLFRFSPINCNLQTPPHNAMLFFVALNLLNMRMFHVYFRNWNKYSLQLNMHHLYFSFLQILIYSLVDFGFLVFLVWFVPSNCTFIYPDQRNKLFQITVAMLQK